MSDYCERFSEVWSLLATIEPASSQAEQNTGFVSLANYHRAVIIIHVGALGGDVDCDVEQAINTSGDDVKTVQANTKDITLTAVTDDDTVSVIEVRTAELDVDNRFDCINLEMTPAQAGIVSAQIWGGVSRYQPVPTTNLDSVTD